MPGKLKVLIIEPYHGGSHKNFIEHLLRLPFAFEVMALPARKWKWRMRLSAPHFADALRESGKKFDRVICSTFLDVAALRGMAPAWVRNVPLLTFFHENQFAYPVQVDDERDFHFALTNMTTALASDSIAFNSEYNLKTFIEGLKGLRRHATDMSMERDIDTIEARARVMPLGLDFDMVDSADARRADGPPVVLWNHRWEHDKNPDLFFETLMKLAGDGVDFRLIVLGQSFERRPDIFDRAKRELSHKIIHFGYAESPIDYARLLRQGDIVVSTSHHEFFGISVVEAVRAGCRPLLPRRLSYPEMFPDEFLYDDADFAKKLKDAVESGGRLSKDKAVSLTDRFSWSAVSGDYEEWIRDARIWENTAKRT